MISPLLSLPGAVAAVAPDAGVAWHYGDPLAEQRATAESAGWTDRSHRDVIAVSGPERLSWLHALLTQHVLELPPLVATEALILDPHGRVEDAMNVVDDGVRTFLDLEPGRGEPVRNYLEKMKFWSKVEIETPDLAVLSVVGPDTAAVLRAAEVTAAVARTTTWPAGGGTDLLVAREDLEGAAARLSAAGARAMGTWGFEALRVAARVPRLGLDTDDKTIPHEVGWIGSAVHLQKGCYRGQETVARVQNLGRPPRRLVLVHLDGSDTRLPAHGAPVTVPGGERPVGFVGTAERHYELGPVALAVVKRTVEDTAELMLGDVSGSIDAS